MPGSSIPIETFCSYAHKDEHLQQVLKKHLSSALHQGLITLWYDRLIAPGTDWALDIDAHLNNASVILLLISPDFLASDYCYGLEMQRALERDRVGEARVIPILLRPVDWKDEPIARLQALPTDAKPITSWRNRDEAFADVAAGVRRAIKDLSLQPASMLHAKLPAIWNIPYPRNPLFIGREELLSLIHTHFQGGQATAISQVQALSGLGGIGKTQIAVEYAYRYRQDYQAVLWARADTREELISSYVTLAGLLKLPEHDAQDQQITIQAVKNWLHGHSQWLLILDNADELALIPEFLPPALGGHLLLTTRASALGRLAQRVEVQTFSTEQGALFLLRRSALIAPSATIEQAAASDRTLAMQIAEELGGLPLALDQAGAYLEETGFSLVAYQQLYQRRRADLLKERRGLIADHPEPVINTWSLSFARIEQRSPAAADLLRLCAFLAPDSIPEEILTQGAPHLGSLLASVAADLFLLGQAIEVARAYSLIRSDPRTRTLSMHRLVQAVLQDAMPAKVRKRWRKRAIFAVNAAFPHVKLTQWEACERCVPHALLCAHWIEQEQIVSPEAVRLLDEAGYYLRERARFAEAEPLYLRALAICEQQLGPEHPDTGDTVDELAMIYEWQGRNAEAEPLYLRALAIREQYWGAEHPTTATSLHNLAGFYERRGRLSEAEPLYLRALAIKMQYWGAEHYATADTLNNLARLYTQQGRYAEAEPMLRRALAIREQYWGAEHPTTAASLDNLADLQMEQDRYAEAEPLYQRALAIRERRLGSEHPDTLVVRKNYASLLRIMGRDAEAASLEARRV